MHHPKQLIALACATALGLCALAAPSPAGAAEPDGWWYYTQTGAQAANEAGHRGQGVTIAVLDSQYNAEASELQNADITSLPSPCDGDENGRLPATSTEPGAGHATDMIALMVGDGTGINGGKGIIGVAPDAKIVHVAIGQATSGLAFECQVNGNSDTNMAYGQAIRDVVDAGADIISISNSYNPGGAVQGAFAYALGHGAIIVGAMPNDAIAILDAVPVFNGVVGVERTDQSGELVAANKDGTYTSSQYIDVVSPGKGILRHDANSADWTEQYSIKDGGNSSATAITSAMLAVVKSKYPEATNNQILQSLIRNTGPEPHDLYYDVDKYWGYGATDLNLMLANDPTQYPDINPLITDNDLPFPDEIARYASSSASPEPTEPSTSAAATPDATTQEPSPSTSTSSLPSTDSSGLPTLAWVGIGIGVVLLVALVAVVAMRSRHKGAQT